MDSQTEIGKMESTVGMWKDKQINKKFFSPKKQEIQ